MTAQYFRYMNVLRRNNIIRGKKMPRWGNEANKRTNKMGEKRKQTLKDKSSPSLCALYQSKMTEK